MADDASIRISGLRELNKALRDLGDRDLKKALQRVNKSAAQMVQDRSKQLAPVRTGTLRDSIKARATVQSGKVIAGTARVNYAAAIMFGTGSREGLRGPHNIKKNPFMFDALASARSQIVRQYASAIDELLDEVRKSRPSS